MFDRLLITLVDDTSRLDRLSKCVLLRSVFIVLPIIRNQRKTETISHIDLETLLIAILDTKLKRFYDGFFEMVMLEMFTIGFFYQTSLVKSEVI